jgi:uncharacterized OsmC-like protein
MSSAHIRSSIAAVARYLSENPDKARVVDKAAVATLQGGLTCKAQGPGGAVLVSDMPKAVGGDGSAPTPGWLMRAALANCDATVIAMRAAQLGIELSHLEVTVDSVSDDRGIFGIGDHVAPGPLSMRVSVTLASPGTPQAELEALVHWAEAHSPVGDALRRAIPTSTEITVV